MVTNNAANNKTGASGTVLQGQGVGTASDFSTATFPATTTVSEILYSSATSTIAGLATANSGVLATTSAGVPQINTSIGISSAGEVNMPLQPAFLAIAASVVDVTGNAAAYQMGTTAMAEIFDQNADFNTNGTFTAPVTGKYALQAVVYLEGCTINNGCVIRINTSNRNYNNATYRTASSNDSACGISILADMDVGDTATCVVLGTGEAANTDNILGELGGIEYSFFSGNLEC